MARGVGKESTVLATKTGTPSRRSFLREWSGTRRGCNGARLDSQ